MMMGRTTLPARTLILALTAVVVRAAVAGKIGPPSSGSAPGRLLLCWTLMPSLQTSSWPPAQPASLCAKWST